MSSVATFLLLLTVSGLSISAVLAFWWAGSSGQFHDVERGAMSVFDVDELVAGTIQPEGTHGNRSL